MQDNKTTQEILDKIANLMLGRSADERSHLYGYNQKDLENACLIFMSVAQYIGITNGTINSPEKAEEVGEQFRKSVIAITGIDPHNFYKNKSTK
jgi:hypothetical protein